MLTYTIRTADEYYKWFDNLGHYKLVDVPEKDKLITIQIKLIDNEFIYKWKNYLIETHQRVPHVHWYITRFNNNTKHLQPSNLIVNLARLYSSFMFFQKHNAGDFTKEIQRIEHLFEHPEETTQNDLNIWHRHFTTMEQRYSNDNNKTPPNTLTADLYEYIQDVNQFTHRCEGYTYAACPRRQKYGNMPMYTVQFTNANNHTYFANNENRQVWTSSTPRFPTGTFDCFNENTDYDVWLHEDIIGKDQIKAWLDHDDLKEFDVAGNEIWTPNIAFDPHKLFHSVIQDEDFKRESKESGKTLDRLPIGNIITDVKTIDWELVLTGRVIRIEVDDQLLWNYNENYQETI